MSDVNFIQVGDLANGFEHESNLISLNDELVGKRFELFFPDHPQLILVFDNKNTLTLTDKSHIEYRCTSIRESVYFIDFIDPEDLRGTITIVIDLTHKSVTLVYGNLPTYEEVGLAAFHRIKQNLNLTDVRVTIHFGFLVNDLMNMPFHHFTDELIGYRNQYIYSATEKYEHIYLNEKFYTWHCIEGVEKGLADVDRCHYIKITEQLYLFIWREKIVPTLGIILIDMAQLRTDGKILGYKDADFEVLSNFQVGSFAQVLHIQSK